MSSPVSTTRPTPTANTTAAPAPPIPSIPADLALPTVEGGTLRFGDLRGKQVLLFCWASW